MTAIKGTNNISKYFYSIDGGNSFIESTSNSYTFNNLSKGNYKIIVKIADINEKYSNIYMKNEIIFTDIFYIDNVKYVFEEGMTWEQWVNSKYNNSCKLSSLNVKCSSKYVRVSNESELLQKNELIIANNHYLLSSGGPGKVL